MDSSSSSEEETSAKTKLRISLRLAPGQNSALRVPSDPIAVPRDIRRRGLSAVVNHLLGRSAGEGGGGRSDDDRSDDDDGGPPPVPFDFLLSQKLLRLPLEAAVRAEGVSTERAVEVLYFPARSPPVREGRGESVPDWIGSMDYFGGGGGVERKGVLFAGCADGLVRSFSCGDDDGMKALSGVAAHTGPIHCLSTLEFGDDGSSALVATGSMDQTLVTHLHNADSKSDESALDLHAVYSGGHSNSVGSVAMRNNGHDVLVASGDWDGGLVLWNVPGNGTSNDEDDTAEESNSKRQKGSRSKHRRHRQASKRVLEIKPKASARAHASSISGLSFGHASPSTLLTSSWDHSLKVYDLERMDCVLATNGSRVLTSLSRCSNGNVVATGCADNMVRLWDMRVGGGGGGVGGVGQVADKTLRQSHKSWVSDVRWSSADPFVLASTSHDGTLKVWDIRSSVPLHTVKAVSKKGEKALCLAFGKGSVYSGGSDCVVNEFACDV